MMHLDEIMENICLSLFGITAYIGFLLIFIWAVRKGEFIFHNGRIHGKLARVIGIFGLFGMAAGTYLTVSIYIFDKTPPFAEIAALMTVALLVMLLLVRFLSIFMWRNN